MQNKLIVFGGLSSLLLIGVFGWKIYHTKLQVWHLTLATGDQAGDYYPFGQAIAQVVAQQNPKIQIKVIESNGSEDNMSRLERGNAQLIIVQNDATPTPSARIVTSLFREVSQLIVAENSEIKTVSDLRGKRIALMPKGSGSYNSFWFISEHYGLQKGDLKFVAVPWKKATQLFSTGEVDAIFRVLPSGNRFIQELLRKNRGQLISIDQGKAMRIKRPYLEPDLIPKGTYKGESPVPQEDLATVGIQANLLAREDIDPKVIREIAQILFDHRRDLVTANPLAMTIDVPGKDGRLTLPIHPGAQAYYDREKPNLFKENTGAIGLSLSIGTLLTSWFFKLRSQFIKKQKNRADRYNFAIMNLIQQARQAQDLESLEKLQEELFKIFKEIMCDLGEDRIAPESFQSFTFTWETALKTVREREHFLRKLQHAGENLDMRFSQ